MVRYLALAAVVLALLHHPAHAQPRCYDRASCTSGDPALVKERAPMSGNICVFNPFDGALDPWTCAWLITTDKPRMCGYNGVDFPPRLNEYCFSADAVPK